MPSYQLVLERLVKAELPFLIIGTWALALQYPENMEGYEVTDCDLLIPNELKVVKAFVCKFNEWGWTVSLWEDEVTGSEPDAFYRGKWYFRAQLAGLQLDVTYESFRDWEEGLAASSFTRGLPLASLEHILYLKGLKGTEKDHAVIQRFSD